MPERRSEVAFVTLGGAVLTSKLRWAMTRHMLYLPACLPDSSFHVRHCFSLVALVSSHFAEGGADMNSIENVWLNESQFDEVPH